MEKRYISTKRTKINDTLVKTTDGEVYVPKAYLVVNFDVYNAKFTGEWADSENDSIEVEISTLEFELIMDWCCTALLDHKELYFYIHNICMFAHEKGCNILVDCCIEYVAENIINIIEHTWLLGPIMEHYDLYNEDFSLSNALSTYQWNTNSVYFIDLITKDMDVSLIFKYFKSWSTKIAAFKRYLSYGEIVERIDSIVKHLIDEDFDEASRSEIKYIMKLLEKSSGGNDAFKISLQIIKVFYIQD